MDSKHIHNITRILFKVQRKSAKSISQSDDWFRYHWKLYKSNLQRAIFQEQLKILGIKKAIPEPISGLNSENLGDYLTDKSGFVPMAVMDHLESINFNVTPLGQYDIVLGILWLRNHNPIIN